MISSANTYQIGELLRLEPNLSSDFSNRTPNGVIGTYCGSPTQFRKLRGRILKPGNVTYPATVTSGESFNYPHFSRR